MNNSGAHRVIYSFGFWVGGADEGCVIVWVEDKKVRPSKQTLYVSGREGQKHGHTNVGKWAPKQREFNPIYEPSFSIVKTRISIYIVEAKAEEKLREIEMALMVQSMAKPVVQVATKTKTVAGSKKVCSLGFVLSINQSISSSWVPYCSILAFTCLYIYIYIYISRS